MIIFLIGPPGTGKSYLGHLLQKHFGFHFYEADSDLPSEWKAASKRHTITDKMRKDFMIKISHKIDELSTIHPNLVLGFPARKEKHRRLFHSLSPDVKFVWVQAPEEQRVDRIRRRGGHPIDPEYAISVAKFYERPQIPHHTFFNDDSDEKTRVIHLKKLLSDLASS